eukprot:scaffold7340_cov266-Pinguiococcus_pyrenoidosus.AAC.18
MFPKSGRPLCGRLPFAAALRCFVARSSPPAGLTLSSFGFAIDYVEGKDAGVLSGALGAQALAPDAPVVPPHLACPSLAALASPSPTQASLAKHRQPRRRGGAEELELNFGRNGSMWSQEHSRPIINAPVSQTFSSLDIRDLSNHHWFLLLNI